MPLVCVSTAFAAKAVPFLAVLRYKCCIHAYHALQAKAMTVQVSRAAACAGQACIDRMITACCVLLPPLLVCCLLAV